MASIILLAFLVGAVLGALALLVLALHQQRRGRDKPHLAKVMVEMDREARRNTGCRAGG